MSVIRDVHARKILDSRGNATLEVDVLTDAGFGRAAAPSGASTGAHEVAAWAEGGVAQSIEFVNNLVDEELNEVDALLQRDVDEMLVDLDGTTNFAKLGGNAAVAVSLAVARAGADELGVPLYAYLGGTMVAALPRPFGNVLGGGAHAVGGTDIQEFMTVALGPTATDSVFANAFVHKRVKELLKKELPNAALGKGDEGAWVAAITNERALKIVSQAAKDASSEFEFDVRVAIDVAATELYDAKKKLYVYKDKKLKPAEQVEYLAGLVEEFDLYSVEDGLAEDDWDAWAAFTKKVGKKTMVLGDDLFTTDPERLIRGINAGSANAILVKPNQIGTLSRTVDTISLAHEHGFRTVISHRSGETTDNAIAHIGAAFRCLGIKTGAVGGERIAKLNELIRIEEEI
ncbi:MAG: phosphopyruvate hydratase [Thermoplasmatota archaeon]